MDTVRLDPACISCLLKKHLHAAPQGTPKETQTAYMQRVLRLMADASPQEGAPVLVHDIEALQREMLGVSRDYTQEKQAFGSLMLSLEGKIAAQIADAPDSLYAAVQYAMIGNYIDSGTMEKIDEDMLRGLLNDSQRFAPQRAAYEAFRADVLSAGHIVYLTDNCGEIVMDKLLLREMHRLNPQAEMTVIVRGEPVLNDATMEDALAAGLDEHAAVMGNGSCIAGTCLGRISPQARETIDGADMLIAKGQANFETLRRCGRNVYYIFLCKCDLFASRFGVERFQGMLLRDRDS